MKTNVTETSIAAYRGLDLTAGQGRIMAFLLDNIYRADWTRNELAKLSGIPINCVCGRVFELIEKGALQELAPRADKFTQETARPFAVVAER